MFEQIEKHAASYIADECVATHHAHLLFVNANRSSMYMCMGGGGGGREGQGFFRFEEFYDRGSIVFCFFFFWILVQTINLISPFIKSAHHTNILGINFNLYTINKNVDHSTAKFHPTV